VLPAPHHPHDLDGSPSPPRTRTHDVLARPGALEDLRPLHAVEGEGGLVLVKGARHRGAEVLVAQDAPHKRPRLEIRRAVQVEALAAVASRRSGERLVALSDHVVEAPLLVQHPAAGVHALAVDGEDGRARSEDGILGGEGGDAGEDEAEEEGRPSPHCVVESRALQIGGRKEQALLQGDEDRDGTASRTLQGGGRGRWRAAAGTGFVVVEDVWGRAIFFLVKFSESHIARTARSTRSQHTA
jgi:hypothetical protein